MRPLCPADVHSHTSVVCSLYATGKYQNVLRECGQPVAQPTLPQSATAAAAGAPPAPLPPLAYSPAHPAALAQHVKAAHAAASSALLAFVLRGGGGAGAAGGGGRALGGPGGLGGGGGGGGAGLVAVLRSMKHFFLLDQVGMWARCLGGQGDIWGLVYGTVWQDVHGR